MYRTTVKSTIYSTVNSRICPHHSYFGYLVVYLPKGLEELLIMYYNTVTLLLVGGRSLCVFLWAEPPEESTSWPAAPFTSLSLSAFWRRSSQQQTNIIQATFRLRGTKMFPLKEGERKGNDEAPLLFPMMYRLLAGSPLISEMTFPPLSPPDSKAKHG